MIDEKDFARLEVVELIQKLSLDMNGHSIPDSVRALSVVMAFCIDSASDRKRARELTIEMLDWVLERAGSVGAMDKVNNMFKRV